MPTIQTVLRDPPLRNDQNTKPMQYWFLGVQNSHPLRAIDTSNGGYGEAAPNAGVESSGQTNQNTEITYIKTSSDGNTFTLTGVEGGPYHLVMKFDVIKIKSDGTNWWPVG